MLKQLQNYFKTWIIYNDICYQTLKTILYLFNENLNLFKKVQIKTKHSEKYKQNVIESNT